MKHTQDPEWEQTREQMKVIDAHRGQIPVLTATGSKVHWGARGSSVTSCGRWLKVNGEIMFPGYVPVTCQSCIGDTTRGWTFTKQVAAMIEQIRRDVLQEEKATT